ncbi:MAG: 1-aminocyclopropane-1-carboxylate deaminase [Arcobacter sp.]|nr:1-aminocyclopropane-1-carboxylate deaminase [Arcobacter sp.]
MLINSPVDKVTFQNHNFYIKRDDLLAKDFSGNKARKFHYFLKNNFPNIDTVVSYGSNQSNAMYSLSVLAKLKNWKFKYFASHLPSYLKENPNGNYKYAINNNMQLIVDENFTYTTYQAKPNELFIQEGGAISEASFGIKILADEINTWKIENNIKNLKIFLPSGTGTTALFLQKFTDDEVLTCPCVGDSNYLLKQFQELEPQLTFYPTILKTTKKYHFGKLYLENFEIWKKLKNEINIEFDLLYDPIGWNTLLKYFDKFSDYEILYIHQGGLLGNTTMLQRYVRKYEPIK